MGSRLPEQPSSRPLRHRRRTLGLIEAASVATPPLASRSRRRMGSCACGRRPCGDIGRPMRRSCVARLARGRCPGGSGSTSRFGAGHVGQLLAVARHAEKSETPCRVKMPYCVVAYDIPDDRRRLRLSRVLWGMLDRVQKSVFEGSWRSIRWTGWRSGSAGWWRPAKTPSGSTRYAPRAGDASGASAHPPSGRTRTFG
jgi:hypothetical protein